MSNLSVTRNNGEKAQPTAEVLSPLRIMQRLLGFDPFREMAPFVPIDPSGFAFNPPFEVKETKEAYEFRSDVPGVTEMDIEITITGNRLTIAGKREAEAESKSDTYFATERVYGTFVRSFTLPDGIDADHVRATLDNGVLSITVPKKPEAHPKKISVTPPAREMKS